MTTLINADTIVGGAVITADTSGELGLQAAGSTKLTVAASGVTLANALPVGSGGTGATTLTGVLKGNGTSAVTASNVNLASEVTGTLPVANGGTGATTLAGAGIPAISASTTFTGANTFRTTSGTRFEEASTQDAIIIDGRAGGTSSFAVTLTPATLSASRTVTIPNETFTVGFRNLPAVGTQTGSYTLGVNDVGKYVQVSTGGSITIPTSTFAEGDAITIYNNTTGNVTITCSAPTAYIAGTNTIRTSMTLATRGIATVLFYSATACVVSGNVT